MKKGSVKNLSLFFCSALFVPFTEQERREKRWWNLLPLPAIMVPNAEDDKRCLTWRASSVR